MVSHIEIFAKNEAYEYQFNSPSIAIVITGHGVSEFKDRDSKVILEEKKAYFIMP